MNNSNYDGRQDDIRDWKTPAIEIFENMYPDREYSITMTITEFTCVCPKTGLPDFAQLTVHYQPSENCIELKSFKEYLLEYRNKGIFHENVVNKVVDDLVKAIAPKHLKMVGVFNSRGGIQTTIQREYSAK